MSHHEEKPIRGLLILLVIFLAATAVRSVIQFFTGPVVLFLADRWLLLTTPGSDAYHPLWAACIVTEMVLHLGSMVAIPAALTLLTFRSPRFPAFTVAYLVAASFLLVSTHLMVEQITQDHGVTPPPEGRLWARLWPPLVWHVFWVVYLLNSLRVKETFPGARSKAAA